MFQQACADLGRSRDLAVLDPLAGVAYMLTVVALLHGESIERLIAVDVDPAVRAIGEANLCLTSLEGVSARAEELRAMARRFDRDSHLQATRSAERLRTVVEAVDHRIDQRFELADSLDPTALSTTLDGVRADIVLTDVPYGTQVAWSTSSGAVSSGDPVARLLVAIRTVTADDAIAALSMPKASQVAKSAGWAHVRHAVIGHRWIVYLRRVEGTL